ncbi:molecular chaperone HtpG [Congzhengia minquanensis]|uniref:Chaperone protein HtpG n=1 Tax=Congzhengia minquanensis TaxID=2763657 RepID=A0A926HZZ1_9FIRM|nr:molecular chaperone HtpG [Congzhengia minquanensis]MBC8541371.1 molecular chaperone HtpG [Congzhengia minquanensis]
MAKKAFKSESKRLLDMMIHSIYTHKEIFLRELVSNASDSIDKLYYIALTDDNITFNKDDYYIRIETDEKNRTLTISDTGIGMSKEELEENLGTIAKSGSFDFKSDLEHEEDHDIIGQFGVGFYSAFMVADKVTVISKKYGEEDAYKWESEGADGYTVTKSAKDEVGTKIILTLKSNADEENYDEFLSEYTIRRIIKKYSDYIRYPIKMMVKKSRPKPGTEGEGKTPEYEDYFEDETLNSMVPIWRKNKSELKDEDYNNFYKEKFFDYDNPAAVIHTSADGITSYKALMFLPARAPYDYYSKDFEKGLALYANGVLIMDKCADLLPDCFSFVKGLVDSADLSLNISREMLQHDRQLQIIAKNLQKKIKSELIKLMKDDRETYEKFYSGFGRQLKFSVYNEFGREKELVQDLILFYSIKEKKLVSLKEYIEKMPEDQKFIYYACGESNEKIEKLPQTELVKDKGYDILCFTDDIDEFAIKMLGKYEEKEFKSVSSGDLGFETEAKQEESEENKEIFLFMKDALGDKVKDVKASTRLKSHPVCITSGGELSIEMEKVLNSMPADQKVKAERVLEINVDHPVFEKIKELFASDKEKLKKYADILYGSALLIEGLTVDDPIEFSNNICELI